MQHEERAEKLVRRIESFSDLVMGFSLAFLALTLTIPPHITDLVSNPWWLIAYGWSFAIIAALWYTHQRLFSHYFWPEPGTIVLNFILLSMIGLIVYFVQVFVHYHDEFDRFWAFLAYFTAFGIALVSLGILYWHGVRRRWVHLDGDLRYIGTRYVIRGLGSGSCMLIGVAVCALRAGRTMSDVWPLALLAFTGLVVTRGAVRFMKQRIIVDNP